MSNYQDDNSDESRTTRLDIAKYLAELSEELDNSKVSEEENIREVELSGSKKRQDPEIVTDEYSSLAKAGEWKKLLELTEGAYNNGSLKTKIWWIASQYHLKLMPVGLLAAPLEAASSKIVDDEGSKKELDNETLKVTEDLLAKVGKKLFEENELELGDTLYQRAIKLNPSYLKEYKKDLKAFKEREENAPATIGSIERLSFLEEKLGDVSTIGNVEVDSEVFSQSLPLERGKNSSSIFGFLFLLILLALVLYGSYRVFHLIEGKLPIIAINDAKVPYEVLDEKRIGDMQLKNPELRPQLIPDSGSLGGILRALNEPNQEHKGEIKKELETTHSNGEADNSSLGSKKVPEGSVVNTKSPLEPEEIRQIVSRESESEITSEFDRINKPILGTMDKTKPIVPAYVIPPKSVEETAKMYEIKEYTEIRGEPNMTAPVLEKLITGDRVRVAEKFGRWARIVSKGGRDGYIQKSALGREI